MILNKHWNLLIPIVPLWERGARDICLVENGEEKEGDSHPLLFLSLVSFYSQLRWNLATSRPRINNDWRHNHRGEWVRINEVKESPAQQVSQSLFNFQKPNGPVGVVGVNAVRAVVTGHVTVKGTVFHPKISLSILVSGRIIRTKLVPIGTVQVVNVGT